MERFIQVAPGLVHGTSIPRPFFSRTRNSSAHNVSRLGQDEAIPAVCADEPPPPSETRVRRRRVSSFVSPWASPGLFDYGEWNVNQPSAHAVDKATTAEVVGTITERTQLADLLKFGSDFESAKTLHGDDVPAAAPTTAADPAPSPGNAITSSASDRPSSSFLCFTYGPTRSGKTTLLLGSDCAKQGDTKDETKSRRTSAATTADDDKSSLFVQSFLGFDDEPSSGTLSMAGCMMFQDRQYGEGGQVTRGTGDGIAVVGDCVFAAFLNDYFLRTEGGVQRLDSMVHTAAAGGMDMAVVEFFGGEWFDLLGRELHNLADPKDATYRAVPSPIVGMLILMSAQARRAEVCLDKLSFSVSNLVIVVRVRSDEKGENGQPGQRLGYFVDMTGCDELDPTVDTVREFGLKATEVKRVSDSVAQLRMKLLAHFLDAQSSADGLAQSPKDLYSSDEKHSTRFVNPRLTRWTNFLSSLLRTNPVMVGIFTLRGGPETDDASRAALRFSAALPAIPFVPGFTVDGKQPNASLLRCARRCVGKDRAATEEERRHALEAVLAGEMASGKYEPLPWERRHHSVLTSLVSGGATPTRSTTLPSLSRIATSRSFAGAGEESTDTDGAHETDAAFTMRGVPALSRPPTSGGRFRDNQRATPAPSQRRPTVSLAVPYTPSSTDTTTRVTSEFQGASEDASGGDTGAVSRSVSSAVHVEYCSVTMAAGDPASSTPPPAALVDVVLPVTPKAPAATSLFAKDGSGHEGHGRRPEKRSAAAAVSPRRNLFPVVFRNRYEEELLLSRLATLAELEEQERLFLHATEAQSRQLIARRAGIKGIVSEHQQQARRAPPHLRRPHPYTNPLTVYHAKPKRKATPGGSTNSSSPGSCVAAQKRKNGSQALRQTPTGNPRETCLPTGERSSAPCCGSPPSRPPSTVGVREMAMGQKSPVSPEKREYTQNKPRTTGVGTALRIQTTPLQGRRPLTAAAAMLPNAHRSAVEAANQESAWDADGDLVVAATTAPPPLRSCLSPRLVSAGGADARTPSKNADVHFAEEGGIVSARREDGLTPPESLEWAGRYCQSGGTTPSTGPVRAMGDTPYSPPSRVSTAHSRRASSAASLPQLRRYSMRVAAEEAELVATLRTGKVSDQNSPVISAATMRRASSAHSSLPVEERLYPLVQLYHEDLRKQQALLGEELLHRNEVELDERRARRRKEASMDEECFILTGVRRRPSHHFSRPTTGTQAPRHNGSPLPIAQGSPHANLGASPRPESGLVRRFGPRSSRVFLFVDEA